MAMCHCKHSQLIHSKCALGEWVTEMAFVNSVAIMGTASCLSCPATVCKLLPEISVETQFIRLPNQISHTAPCRPNSLLVAGRSVTTNILPPSPSCRTLCCLTQRNDIEFTLSHGILWLFTPRHCLFGHEIWLYELCPCTRLGDVVARYM